MTGLVAAQAGSLKIESWRNDDADIWNSKIIPAFNKTYPDIKVEFAPSAPKEYNASLNARLDGGQSIGRIRDAANFDLNAHPARKSSHVPGCGTITLFCAKTNCAWLVLPLCCDSWLPP